MLKLTFVSPVLGRCHCGTTVVQDFVELCLRRPRVEGGEGLAVALGGGRQEGTGVAVFRGI